MSSHGGVFHLYSFFPIIRSFPTFYCLRARWYNLLYFGGHAEYKKEKERKDQCYIIWAWCCVCERQRYRIILPFFFCRNDLYFQYLHFGIYSSSCSYDIDDDDDFVFELFFFAVACAKIEKKCVCVNECFCCEWWKKKKSVYYAKCHHRLVFNSFLGGYIGHEKKITKSSSLFISNIPKDIPYKIGCLYCRLAHIV